VLAHAGLGSRRACEEFILQGRVTVDGKVVRELGTRVEPGRQKVAVDGQPVRAERLVYYAVCKPKGYVSTNADPSGRPRVVDLLPEIPERVYAVGRLDEASVGLMILTNDGALANKLTHPKYGVEKIYRAVVAGSPDQEVLDKLTEGVWLAEGKARAKKVRIVGKQGDATILEMVLAEGKNREVRRMLAKLGHKVMSLTRVMVGPISLKGLRPGGWRHLSAHEVELLRKVADGIPVATGRTFDDRPAPAPRRGPNRPDRVVARRAAEPRPGGPPRRPDSRPRLASGTEPRGGAPGRPARVPPKPDILPIEPSGPKILGLSGSVRRLEPGAPRRPGGPRRPAPPGGPRTPRKPPMLRRPRRPRGPGRGPEAPEGEE
jgi:23S rRNA pseudouridine2605 synthase